MTKEPTAAEMLQFIKEIADYVRYGEAPGLFWEADADAVETANWCIVRARDILGLPETSAEEEERAEAEREDFAVEAA